jgi:hypothetical protein
LGLLDIAPNALPAPVAVLPKILLFADPKPAAYPEAAPKPVDTPAAALPPVLLAVDATLRIAPEDLPTIPLSPRIFVIL